MKTLYVTDLDGTFLSSAGRTSEYSMATINRLLSTLDLDFTYATARSFSSARKATAGCAFRLPVIVYGGAFIVDPIGGEFITSKFLDASVAATVVELCRRHHMPPLVYQIHQGSDQVSWVEGEESSGIRNYLAERPKDPRLRPTRSWAGLFSEDTFYVSVIGGRQQIEALTSEVIERAGARCTINVQNDTYHPEETWLEVTAIDANKATAVASLKQHLGCDRLVCFGDNHNDLAMFSIADRAYAVANAVVAVKEAATEVIGKNSCDGVARWLAAHHSWHPPPH